MIRQAPLGLGGMGTTAEDIDMRPERMRTLQTDGARISAPPDLNPQPSSTDAGDSGSKTPAVQGIAEKDKESMEFGGRNRGRTDMPQPTGGCRQRTGEGGTSGACGTAAEQD